MPLPDSAQMMREFSYLLQLPSSHVGCFVPTLYTPPRVKWSADCLGAR